MLAIQGISNGLRRKNIFLLIYYHFHSVAWKAKDSIFSNLVFNLIEEDDVVFSYENPSSYRSQQRSIHNKYRVFLKKVLHKSEEKMQEKLNMTLLKDENLTQVQPQ